ncbi:MAG: hypothetical protein K0R61_3228 [Microvirga sp.]|nr:hypothetical protein [Microvirga sp.]
MTEEAQYRAGPVSPQQTVSVGKQTTTPGTRAGMVQIYYDGTSLLAKFPDGSVRPVELGGATTYTAAQIAESSGMPNTSGKVAGLIVWDSTNSRYMRATGATAASTWKTLDGVTTVTPS